ncbi:uncharacterized protein LOC113233807 isoform X2 [Hyposmocoma kahamanoa]|nr:uncharacterized protein LOC113233807 isoform X2 [Hyposmocoma kahamanoa]
MKALPRRDFMFRNRDGAHVFSTEYYLGIANYMFLWMTTLVIVSLGLFLNIIFSEKKPKKMKPRKARRIQIRMFYLALLNMIIAIVVTILVEISFYLMFKFLRIYHTCSPQPEYLSVIDGIQVIRKAREVVTNPVFKQKHRKLLNKNHADIEFMKLYNHLISQLYYLRYTINTTIFQGTCAVAYWRTTFYTVTANLLWVLVPYFSIQMWLVTGRRPSRTGYYRVKKWALLNYFSCWSLVASLMWLVMIAGDYCYNPAITTANLTYQLDHLTPYYLKVMPFQNIRNAINFFKEMNLLVNHTRFANAFYAPQYGSIVILEMATKFYYDLLEQAAKDKEIDAFVRDIGDPVVIKSALNLTVDQGLIGLYQGKFIRPIHDRLMIIGCRHWVPIVLAILVLTWIMFGTSAALAVYAVKGIRHLYTFSQLRPYIKVKNVTKERPLGICERKQKEAEERAEAERTKRTRWRVRRRRARRRVRRAGKFSKTKILVRQILGRKSSEDRNEHTSLREILLPLV